MVREAEQAAALVAQAQAEPAGLIRFSCPTGLVEVLSALIARFLETHPKVRLQLLATDRPVDLIAERIDLALRVRVALDSDASLTMRSLGISNRILVASPLLASGLATVADLATVPMLATTDAHAENVWAIEAEDGRTHHLRGEARLGCEDFTAVRTAAISGLGVALLPDHVCASALAAGQLARVLPGWRGQQGIVHLVFTTRRGLPPAVRRFIDHLAAAFPANALSRR